MSSAFPGVPATPDALDSGWFTAALRAARIIGDARVASVRLDEIGVGHGYVGRAFRCRLLYDGHAESAPRSVIAKLRCESESRRALFDRFGLYEREVRFYRELKERTPVAAPACFAAERDEASGAFVLLLEDLAPLAPADPIAGSTLAEARDAMTVAAKMHAAWWGSGELDALAWLPAANVARVRDLVSRTYGQAWDAYLARAGELIPARVVRLGAQLGQYLPRILDRLSEPPRTLVHGDFQLGNMFFDANARLAAVIDWQVIIRARGAMDVAHFLVRGLSPDQRRSDEGGLIEAYCDELERSGVRGYGVDACWTDYRLAAASQLGLGIVLAHALAPDPAPVRDPDPKLGSLVATVATRLFEGIVDLDVEELLEPRRWWLLRALTSRR